MESRYSCTAQEAYESLTGFDEIAIRQAFGWPPNTLADSDQMAFARSLVFVMERRAGHPDGAAHRFALEMTVGDLKAAFIDDDDDLAGKDSPPSER